MSLDLTINRRQLRLLMIEGRIPAYRVAGACAIPPSQLSRYLSGSIPLSEPVLGRILGGIRRIAADKGVDLEALAVTAPADQPGADPSTEGRSPLWPETDLSTQLAQASER
jgi:hypothetical protein